MPIPYYMTAEYRQAQIQSDEEAINIPLAKNAINWFFELNKDLPTQQSGWIFDKIGRRTWQTTSIKNKLLQSVIKGKYDLITIYTAYITGVDSEDNEDWQHLPEKTVRIKKLFQFDYYTEDNAYNIFSDLFATQLSGKTYSWQNVSLEYAQKQSFFFIKKDVLNIYEHLAYYLNWHGEYLTGQDILQHFGLHELDQPYNKDEFDPHKPLDRQKIAYLTIKKYKHLTIRYFPDWDMLVDSYKLMRIKELIWCFKNPPFAKELHIDFVKHVHTKIQDLGNQKYEKVKIVSYYNGASIVKKDYIGGYWFGNDLRQYYKSYLAVDIPELSQLNYWNKFFKNRPVAFKYNRLTTEFIEIPDARFGNWTFKNFNTSFGIKKTVKTIVSVASIAVSIFGIPVIGGLVGKIVNLATKVVSTYKKVDAVVDTLKEAVKGDIWGAIKEGANFVGGDIAKAIDITDTVYHVGDALIEGDITDAMVLGGLALNSKEGDLLVLSGKALEGDIDSIKEIAEMVYNEYGDDILKDIDLNVDKFIPKIDINLPNLNLPKIDLPEITIPNVDIPLLNKINIDNVTDFIADNAEKGVNAITKLADKVTPDITIDKPEVKVANFFSKLGNLGDIFDDAKSAISSGTEFAKDLATVFKKEDVVQTAQNTYQQIEDSVNDASEKLADNYVASKLKQYWYIAAIGGVLVVFLIVKK
jgi:hypothetical protein